MFSGELGKRGMPKTPDTFTTTTGEEEQQILKVQERFFSQILDFLGYPEKARGILTHIEDRLMTPVSWSVNHGTQTDDSITILTVGDDRIIAFGIRYRSENNYVQAIFSHCLNPNLVELVRFRVHVD